MFLSTIRAAITTAQQQLMGTKDSLVRIGIKVRHLRKIWLAVSRRIRDERDIRKQNRRQGLEDAMCDIPRRVGILERKIHNLRLYNGLGKEFRWYAIPLNTWTVDYHREEIEQPRYVDRNYAYRTFEWAAPLWDKVNKFAIFRYEVSEVVINKTLLFNIYRAHYVKKYLYTVNHKRIALNYLYFTFISGLAGALLATFIRIELSQPGSHFFKGDSIRYIQVITSHGLVMIFYVVIPIVFGTFANFFIPYHVGSKDVAYPRLNSIGFWILPAGFFLFSKPAFVRRQTYRSWDPYDGYFSMKYDVWGSVNRVIDTLVDIKTSYYWNNVADLPDEKPTKVPDRTFGTPFNGGLVNLVRNVLEGEVNIMSQLVLIDKAEHLVNYGTKEAADGAKYGARVARNSWLMFYADNHMLNTIEEENGARLTAAADRCRILTTKNILRNLLSGLWSGRQVSLNGWMYPPAKKNELIFPTNLNPGEAWAILKEPVFYKTDNKATLLVKINQYLHTVLVLSKDRDTFISTTKQICRTLGDLWINSSMLWNKININDYIWTDNRDMHIHNTKHRGMHWSTWRQLDFTERCWIYEYAHEVFWEPSANGAGRTTEYFARVKDLQNTELHALSREDKNIACWSSVNRASNGAPARGAGRKGGVFSDLRNWSDVSLLWELSQEWTNNEWAALKNTTAHKTILIKNHKCNSPAYVMSGWTFITPFSSQTRFTGVGSQDAATITVVFAGVSSTLSFTNLLLTRRVLGTVGVRNRKNTLPFLSITLLLVMRMLAAITPVLGGAMVMLMFDRHLLTSFFDYAYGGDIILFHHLFWFFGHPEVYVVIIPVFGIVNMILPYYNTRRIASKNHLVWATYVMAYMGFLVWGHHMYLVGLDHRSRSLYSTITVMISLPAVVKIVNWTLTLLNGSLCVDVPFVFIMSFLGFFLCGGLTGLWLSHVGLNLFVHDTFYVVAHFHFMFSCATFSGIFAAVYFYFILFFNNVYAKLLASFHYLCWTAGQWLTFIPLYWVGYNGLPRRYHDYPRMYSGWHGLATIGHLITMLGIICFFYTVGESKITKLAGSVQFFSHPRLFKSITYFLAKHEWLELRMRDLPGVVRGFPIPNTL